MSDLWLGICGVGGIGAVIAYMVAWRLDTGFDPFEQAFGDLPNTLHPTDADVRAQLNAIEGGCSERGFHAPSTTSEA